MADEWVLVPASATDDMLPGHMWNEDWDNILAARPPIPRPVWDAMVERGARGLFKDAAVDPNWFRPGSGPWTWARVDAERVLRAALNNPRIEGDEP